MTELEEIKYCLKLWKLFKECGHTETAAKFLELATRKAFEYLDIEDN